MSAQNQAAKHFEWRCFQFGHSAFGMALLAFQASWGSGAKHVLIIGSVHGNEVEGATAALGLMNYLQVRPARFQNLKLTIIPWMNPDGILRQSRLNGNEVDLNRNLPTKDWNPQQFDPKYPPGPRPNSEPENQALVQLLEQEPPHMIFSLHSWKPMLNVNGDCDDVARVLHEATGYEIVKEMGYPTPGCLGTYAGIERNMSTITYEIERGLPIPKILEIHVPALVKALEFIDGHG